MLINTVESLPMRSFKRIEGSNICSWSGDPTCEAAHAVIVHWLSALPGAFPNPALTFLSTVLQGNLGESLAFFIGQNSDFQKAHAFAANVLTPFSGISKSELDIVWVVFGPKPADDIVVMQEIKTTTASAASYADRLIVDYDKLFGTELSLTLHTRLQAIKLRFAKERQQPDLAERIGLLEKQSGKSASHAAQVRLLPTLVHDLNCADAVGRLAAVRTAVLGLGWAGPSVTCWSISFSDLKNRLLRLANGN